jgi:Transposase IS66 family
VRRKIIEAEKAAPEIAREAIEMVRALYAVEKQATDLPAAERLRLRQTQSAPVLVQFAGALWPLHVERVDVL